MAILIEIVKVSETDREAIYEFGFVGSRHGKLGVDKVTGEVVELDPVPSKNPAFFFSRAKLALEKHYQKGEFPERTDYRA